MESLENQLCTNFEIMLSAVFVLIPFYNANEQHMDRKIADQMGRCAMHCKQKFYDLSFSLYIVEVLFSLKNSE